LIFPPVRPPQDGIPEPEVLPAVNPVKRLSKHALSGKLFRSEHGQGLAEYAVMLGLLLALLFIAKAIGFNANRLFNFAASTFQ
jgi:hypothetical protein